MTQDILKPARATAPGSARARRVLAHGWTALAAAALTAAAAMVAFTVWSVYRLHVVLPIWDAWDTIADWRMVRAGTYGWAELTRQHNEHRLLFPRLFFLLDDAGFAMSDRFELAVTFILQAVTAAVLARLAWRRVADPRFRAILLGFMVIVLFSLDQEQNFTSGFQLQFVGVFTAAVLAAIIYAEGLDRLGAKRLGGARRAGGWVRLALAGLACFVSTYTMANGVLAGFTLVALAVAVRAPWRATLATLMVSAALGALYFHGYVRGTFSRPVSDALAHPLVYLRYLTAYLGNQVGTNTRLTQAFGTVGLAGFALAGWRVASRRGEAPAAAALLGIMGFIVATACATTYGRIDLGTEQAFETRYLTPTAVFWCALVAFWFPVAMRSRTAAAAAALCGLMAPLAASAISSEVAAWPFMIDQTIAITRFRDSLWSGLYDLDASSYENNADTDIRPLLPVLKAERLSLFAEPEPGDVGRPVAALGEVAPASACSGTVTARADPALGRDGVWATGSAWDVGRNGPVRRILTVGRNATIVGFGSPDRPVGRPRTWTGYAKAAAGEPVSAYAVLADGRLCDLGTAKVAAR